MFIGFNTIITCFPIVLYHFFTSSKHPRASCYPSLIACPFDSMGPAHQCGAIVSYTACTCSTSIIGVFPSSLDSWSAPPLLLPFPLPLLCLAVCVVQLALSSGLSPRQPETTTGVPGIGPFYQGANKHQTTHKAQSTKHKKQTPQKEATFGTTAGVSVQEASA